MLTEQLIGNLAEKLEPVAPAPAPTRLFMRWTCLTIAYILVALGFMGVRPDFMAKLSSPLFTAELLALAGIIATSLHSAALLAFPDVYQQKKLAWLPAILFLIFAAILGVEFQADNPPAPQPIHGKECLSCITALSLVPGAFILYRIRRYASTHYLMAGKVATLAAFSIGAATLRISEQTDSISHLLHWHYVPMIGAGIIGLALGRLCLKW